MRVCCTRPREQGESLHVNYIEESHLLVGHTQQRYCSVCGMPLIVKNRYVVLEEKGQGGFGKTFVALDLDSPGEALGQKRRRILKLLHPSQSLSSSSLELVERFFREEAEALEELRHNQIPRLYAFFNLSVPAYSSSYNYSLNREQKLFYLVQEYIEGLDLDKELRQRREQGNNFSQEEIVSVLHEVLGILKFIHANPKKPLIHRDIKPSNIVRRNDDKQLYLIDFGAVKQVIKVVEEGASEGDTVIISPGYSPPEQAHGRTVTFASDLYSLAATCVTLLTGESPLNYGIPYNLEKWKTGVKINQNLVKIINKMLAPDPKQRYQSASEVIVALRKTGLLETEKKLVPLVPLWILAILGVLGVASALYAIVLIINNNKPQSSPLSSNYFTRGEESLLTQDINSTSATCTEAFAKKEAGMREFANENFAASKKDFQAAIDLFRQATIVATPTARCYVDPETQIFLNNAKARNSNNLLTVAVVTPINGNSVEFSKLSEQLLRGVAQVQNKFNLKNGINGRLLEIMIVRDNNDRTIAQRAAKHLAENKIPGDENFRGSVMAVIGNLSSDVILDADKEYVNGELVAVSPTSTAIRQRQKTLGSNYQFDLSRYVFRVAPTDAVAAKDLFKYVQTNFAGKKGAVFYSAGVPVNTYSQSLQQAFVRNFLPNNANNIISCDLSRYGSQGCASQIQGASFLMLSLGTADTDRAFSVIQSSTLPLLGGDALYSDDKLTPNSSSSINNKANNMVLAIPFDIEMAPQWFKKESEQLWGTRFVGWQTASAYDAAQVIIDGLQKQGENPTREGLYNILSSPSFKSTPSATGVIEFDNLSDRKIKPEHENRLGVLVQVKDKCKPEDTPKYRFCRI
ncbi:serine/threonine protein kinase [Calothrix sp. NIES-4071]|nr:serine/threonine protein kinase [Calothrix sp. NIES-4071]BAZ59008.1 serine/threonine protein kinase [Calothrix sp. NIES-4105]